jgi:hypothetical protein
MFFFSRKKPEPRRKADEAGKASSFLPRAAHVVELGGLDALLLTPPENTGHTVDLQLAHDLEQWRGFQTLETRAKHLSTEDAGQQAVYLEDLQKAAEAGVLLEKAALLEGWRRLSNQPLKFPAHFHHAARPPVGGHPRHDALHEAWLSCCRKNTPFLIQPENPGFSPPQRVNVHSLLPWDGFQPPAMPQSGASFWEWESGYWTGKSPALVLARHAAQGALCENLMAPAAVSACSIPGAVVAAEIWSDHLPSGTALLTRTPFAARSALIHPGLPLPPLPPWPDPDLLLWQQTLLSSWSEAWLLILPTGLPPPSPVPAAWNPCLAHLLAYQIPWEWRRKNQPPHSLRFLAEFLRSLEPSMWKESIRHASVFFQTYGIATWNLLPSTEASPPDLEDALPIRIWADQLEHWPLSPTPAPA